VLALIPILPAVFGGYFAVGNGFEAVFVYVVTFIMLLSSVLFWTHTRVLQHLTGFMARCEFAERERIKSSGVGFYFLDYERSIRTRIIHTDKFHGVQRNYHRYIFASLAIVVEAATVVAVFQRPYLMPGHPQPNPITYEGNLALWIALGTSALVTLVNIAFVFVMRRLDEVGLLVGCDG
jgi:hypothetical protein